jgi:tetratricopeptide (TPR) repeat protein
MATIPAGPATETTTPSWRRWLVILFCVSVIGLGGFLGWQWLRDQSERREALRIAAKGDFSRSEPLLLRIALRHPNDAAVAKELALGYFRADRFAEAEPYFEHWCDANSRDPEPYLQRITMWEKWSRLWNAIADIRRVLELQPDNRKLHQQLPRLLLTVGQFDEAEQECQRYLQRWPDDPWVPLIQVLVYQRTDRPREAAAIADHLVRDFADFPEAFLLRGTLYRDANQPNEAIPWFRRAAAIQGPDRPKALYELAKALNQIGQGKEAEQVMKEARLLEEHDFLRGMTGETGSSRVSVSAQARLAEEMLNAGKSEDGLRLLTRLLDKDPNCASAHRVLADYYEKQGQPERAAEHRRRQGFTP